MAYSDLPQLPSDYDPYAPVVPKIGDEASLYGSNTRPQPVSKDEYQHNFDQDALSQLRDLAKEHPEYMETYLQLLAERENTTNAQAWYEKMSGSQYKRAVKDLQEAGINPYLALQSLGGAGSGSVSPAGTWSSSPYANKVSLESAKASKESSDASMIRAIGAIATSVIMMMIMLA